MSLYSVPRIGIGVFVLNQDHTHFVFGQRKGSLGSALIPARGDLATWALPGGHLELGETFEECSAREVLEETGLEVRDLRFMTAANTVMRHGGEARHYVTIFMVAVVERDGAEPELLEPDKCTAWEWVSWRQLLRWGEAQIEASGKGSESEERVLFQPLISLLQQRPGVMPRQFVSSNGDLYGEVR